MVARWCNTDLLAAAAEVILVRHQSITLDSQSCNWVSSPRPAGLLDRLEIRALAPTDRPVEVGVTCRMLHVACCSQVHVTCTLYVMFPIVYSCSYDIGCRRIDRSTSSYVYESSFDIRCVKPLAMEPARSLTRDATSMQLTNHSLHQAYLLHASTSLYCRLWRERGIMQCTAIEY